MTDTDSSTRRVLVSPRALATVVMLTVAVLTIAASVTASRFLDQAAEERLDRRASAALEAIDRRMQAYTESIISGRALFTVGPVDRLAYRQFVSALDLVERYPGIQVLGHASLVSDEDEADYVAAVRADAATAGYPTFTPYPDTTAESRVVIDFVEPTAGNEAAFGLDFLSEANRRSAVQLTRDTGELAATGPVVLVQETGSQSGFLTMVAIYEDLPADIAAQTVQARRQAFRGVQYAAFRMDDLIEGVLGDVRDVRLEVYDVGTVDAPGDPTIGNQTFSDGGTVAVTGADPADSRLMPFDIGGRRWIILYQTLVPIATTVERVTPPLLLLGGLAFALVAGVATAAQAGARERAESRAQQMTADLRASELELARSNEELERFAYVASHDLQEPLRTVSGLLSLLQVTHGDRLDDEARHTMDMAQDGATRMGLLIRELLDFSRAGRTPTTRPVDLSRAWDRAVQDLSAAITETGAVVEAHDLPVVLAEPTGMNQVFLNLLSNALKYRRPGDVRISCRATRQDGMWRVEVADNGIGIPAEHHEDIFVMLQRLHSREEYPGTGMGLAITRKHIESVGGTIGVESEEGAGSTFWMLLPPA